MRTENHFGCSDIRIDRKGHRAAAGTENRVAACGVGCGGACQLHVDRSGIGIHYLTVGGKGTARNRDVCSGAIVVENEAGCGQFTAGNFNVLLAAFVIEKCFCGSNACGTGDVGGAAGQIEQIVCRSAERSGLPVSGVKTAGNGNVKGTSVVPEVVKPGRNRRAAGERELGVTGGVGGINHRGFSLGSKGAARDVQVHLRAIHHSENCHDIRCLGVCERQIRRFFGIALPHMNRHIGSDCFSVVSLTADGIFEARQRCAVNRQHAVREFFVLDGVQPDRGVAGAGDTAAEQIELGFSVLGFDNDTIAFCRNRPAGDADVRGAARGGGIHINGVTGRGGNGATRYGQIQQEFCIDRDAVFSGDGGVVGDRYLDRGIVARVFIVIDRPIVGGYFRIAGEGNLGVCGSTLVNGRGVATRCFDFRISGDRQMHVSGKDNGMCACRRCADNAVTCKRYAFCKIQGSIKCGIRDHCDRAVFRHGGNGFRQCFVVSVGACFAGAGNISLADGGSVIRGCRRNADNQATRQQCRKQRHKQNFFQGAFTHVFLLHKLKSENVFCNVIGFFLGCSQNVCGA